MAKQQYYSNYGSRGRRRRVKPRFYVFVTLIAILNSLRILKRKI